MRHLKHARFVRRRWAERAQGIRVVLDAAPIGCFVLVGDSHAEFLGTPDFDGRPSVNLGIGGSTAADCAAHLAGLPVPIHASASVLFIGTNDILRWRHPERAGVRCRFEAEVRRVLGIMEAWSTRVFVAAVPPIGDWTESRDPASVATFSDRLRALCTEGGHTFFDPFATIRACDPGLARAGMHRDGVHLADYHGLAAEVVRQVLIRPAPGGGLGASTAVASAIPMDRAINADPCVQGRPIVVPRARG